MKKLVILVTFKVPTIEQMQQNLAKVQNAIDEIQNHITSGGILTPELKHTMELMTAERMNLMSLISDYNGM
jgi:hypothetical protein